MRHLKYIFTAAIAAALAFASCTKEIEAPDETGQEEESYSRETGAPVVFGVSTGDDNEAQTKAEEYSEEIFTSVNGELQKIGEVSTGYDEGPETKADYSGRVSRDPYSRKYIERINWELGDRIHIRYVTASDHWNWSDYSISKILSNVKRTSKARINPTENIGLRWRDESEHCFFAIYPSHREARVEGNNEFIIVANNDIYICGLAKIPHIQYSKGKPIMTAFKRATKSEASPVNLYFSPAVNTFDIRIKNTRQNQMTIKRVILESQENDLSGNYNIYHYRRSKDERGYVFYPGTSPNFFGKPPQYPNEKHNTVEHFCGNTGKTLEPQEEFSVRLYTFPIDIKDLSLVIEESDGHKTALELKNKQGGWIDFHKEKKYNIKGIKMPERPAASGYEYVFKPKSPLFDTLRYLPFEPRFMYRFAHEQYFSLNNKSLKPPMHEIECYKVQTGGGGNKVSVPWCIRSGEYDRYLTNNTKRHYSGDSRIDLFMTTWTYGDRFGEDEYGQAASQMEELNMDGSGWVDIQNGLDLSKGRGGSLRNTANCYRIDRPGKYRFPLIYGNCIRRGEFNEDAFRPIAGSEMLQTFVDGEGNAISRSNYKADATSLRIVWQDSGNSIIENLKIKEFYDDPNSTTKYATFEINKRFICPGNVLIAAVKNNITLWTWHIWLFPYKNPISGDGEQEGKISKWPLGYRPAGRGCKALDFTIPLAQMEQGGKKMQLPVRIIKAYPTETCVFYTYGRLAPTPTSSKHYYIERENNGVKTYITSLDPNLVEIDSDTRVSPHTPESQSWMSIQEAIAYPHKISKRMAMPVYTNLWNSSRYNQGYNPRRSNKTVYDPCPVGYRVPTAEELTSSHFSQNFFENMTRYGKFYSYDSLHYDAKFKEFRKTIFMLDSKGKIHRFPGNTIDTTEGQYVPIFPIKESAYESRGY